MLANKKIISQSVGLILLYKGFIVITKDEQTT